MQAPLGAALRQQRPTLSFEFFPPKSPAGEHQLTAAVRALEPLEPDFVSVTFGAGGGSSDRIGASLRVLGEIRRETSLKVVAHLTCVGLTRSHLRQTLSQFTDVGVSTVLALRGDPASGQSFETTPGGLTWAAQLVELAHHGAGLEVGVAAFPYGHPECADLEQDSQVLAAKQRAGAAFAVTQMFFEDGAYRRMMQRHARAGVTIPVIPGLMPPTRMGQLARLESFAGAALPAPLVQALGTCADDDEVRRVGVSWLEHLGAQLLEDGAPGLHFYTLNQSTATAEVARRLGLGRA